MSKFDPDFVTFRKFVQEELDYLLCIDLSSDLLDLRAAAALVTLLEYLDVCIEEEKQNSKAPEPEKVIRTIAEHVRSELPEESKNFTSSGQR